MLKGVSPQHPQVPLDPDAERCAFLDKYNNKTKAEAKKEVDKYNKEVAVIVSPRLRAV